MVSPFTQIPQDEWTASNELAFAIRDGFPVTAGHTLVITRRVVTTWFDATEQEQNALMQLVNVVKRNLDDQLSPNQTGTTLASTAATLLDKPWNTCIFM